VSCLLGKRHGINSTLCSRSFLYISLVLLFGIGHLSRSVALATNFPTVSSRAIAYRAYRHGHFLRFRMNLPLELPLAFRIATSAATRSPPSKVCCGFYIEGADVSLQYLLACGKQGSAGRRNPRNVLGGCTKRRVAARMLVYTEAWAVAFMKRARLRADSICSSEVVH